MYPRTTLREVHAIALISLADPLRQSEFPTGSNPINSRVSVLCRQAFARSMIGRLTELAPASA
jgi:hypothetical protein